MAASSSFFKGFTVMVVFVLTANVAFAASAHTTEQHPQYTPNPPSHQPKSSSNVTKQHWGYTLPPSYQPKASSPSADQPSRNASESSQRQRFLEECARKMNEKCAKEIVMAVFEDKKVSRKCCIKVVNMGNKCHHEMIKRLKKIHLHHLKPKKIKSKSEKVYRKCQKIAKKHSSSPAS
uniref:Prolamin-like domain-containing protein n=1 Tax=Nicotiana tabacum TaxID=4097 RepID=A0A1S4BT85_TOBAC|nr:PREDICTED: uncharacterized protein LOC107811647 [Nicotiana tabacum]XP_033513997.1 protein DOWN-REGULATED IN DIF1 11-like [Nicotiana tomentosiformis]